LPITNVELITCCKIEEKIKSLFYILANNSFAMLKASLQEFASRALGTRMQPNTVKEPESVIERNA